MKELIQQQAIESMIFVIRGYRVMIDRDLAELYGVETRVLNQAVNRNIERFPKDFMFQLTKKEMKNWISQIVISNNENMGIRRMPYVFTEQGVAMLSGVLKSKRAIQVNIHIMRAFVKLRRAALTYAGLRRKIDEMEQKYDAQFGIVFKAIKRLLMPSPKPKPPTSFSIN
ncbi:MAG: ORF6N domain-containing protein [Candidatus Omnitrophota bacterium]|nr:ORF6N domain-containing protein [Candidatus Omnitrophota bacterium]